MVKQNVLGFQIPMGNQVEMGCLHPLNNLKKKGFGHPFTQVMFLEIVVELPPWSQFHDHKDVLAGVEHFIKFDDIGVTDQFEYPNFAFDLGCRMGTLEIILLLRILALLMILTATLAPVSSCLPSW